MWGLKRLSIPAVCASLLLIGWAATKHFSETDLANSAVPLQQATATDPLAIPSGPGSSRIGLALDPDNATDLHVARDLGRIVAPDAGVELVVQPGVAWFSNDALPRIALMRYEYLQILRAINDPGAAAAIDSLRVLMPLYTEEIYLIARRDSPLNFIHQVEGARINVGIEHSSRRLTVARLYQSMFGSRGPHRPM